MEPVGERIKRLRLQKQMKRKELEELAGVPNGTVSKLERGAHSYPSVGVAMRLAWALGISLDYLCGMDDFYRQKEAESRQESTSEPDSEPAATGRLEPEAVAAVAVL
jgi:transcriptional regulator with XRE-family HTH domain